MVWTIGNSKYRQPRSGVPWLCQFTNEAHPDKNMDPLFVYSEVAKFCRPATNVVWISSFLRISGNEQETGEFFVLTVCSFTIVGGDMFLPVILLPCRFHGVNCVVGDDTSIWPSRCRLPLFIPSYNLQISITLGIADFGDVLRQSLQSGRRNCLQLEANLLLEIGAHGHDFFQAIGSIMDRRPDFPSEVPIFRAILYASRDGRRMRP